MLLGNSVTASVIAKFLMTLWSFASSKHEHAAPLAEDSNCPKDDDQDTHRVNDVINDLIKSNQHSEFVNNILEYISGFVVAKLMKKVKCPSCIANLTGSLPKPPN